MKNPSNLDAWSQYGDSLLVVQPYMDNIIVSGEGSYMIDVEGNRILDMAAGQFCNVLGYNHPKFVKAIQDQSAKLVHVGDQYIPDSVLECTQNVAEIAPGDLNKVLLLSTGSEANECAMRMAKAVTHRSGMMAYTRGYYGITLATRGLSSVTESSKTDFQPVPEGQLKILTPTCDNCPLGLSHSTCKLRCLETSLSMNSTQLANIAAVIVEPIVSAGGMILPPQDYVHKLRDVASQIGALFIVDEAQTGFGRCGTWFDIEHYDVEPDILVFSKTSGNGYPVAGIVVTDEVAKKLEKSGFAHLSSHQNDPIAAAAVNSVISIIKEENLLEHVKMVGSYFMSKLNKLKNSHDCIADIRGRGLMIGMELKDIHDGDGTFAFDIAMFCEQAGLHITYTYYEPVIRFIPPLTITEREIDQAIEVLNRALNQRSRTKTSHLGPKNHRSKPYVEQMKLGYSASRILKKLWSTSPADIVKKLHERVGK